MLKKLIKKRKQKIARDEWVVGENLTKAGRERGRRRRMLRKVGGKATIAEGMKSKKRGLPGAKETVASKKKAYGIKSKVKKKDLADKGTKLTKAGVYPKYKQKSKSAQSFREAFKANCKGKGAGTMFKWDGREYTCARGSSAPKKYKGQGPSKSLMGEKKQKVKKGTNPGGYSFRGGPTGRNV
jgi:hypothetical protein